MSQSEPHQAGGAGRSSGLESLIGESVAPPAGGELGPVKAAIRKLTVRLGRPHARHQQEISRQLLQSVRELQSGDAGVQPQLDELRAWLQSERNGVAEASAQLKAHAQQLEQLTAQLDVEAASAGRFAEFESRLARAEALTAIDVPLDGGPGLQLETFEAGPAGTVVGYRGLAPGNVDPNAVYRGFEDFFRGSEEVISDRQRAYLPIVAGHGLVLDIGCGRGEFLELLGEQQIEAKGIDLDPAMVARCHAKGLRNVEQADALEYLEAADAGSIGVIFACQVIEHLGFERLQRFLVLGSEKLAPGGLLVIETVNPHNPQSLKHFWIDPTHRNPLFPEAVIALCHLVGYESGYVWHPGGSGDPDRDRSQMGDYSVVAQTRLSDR